MDRSSNSILNRDYSVKMFQKKSKIFQTECIPLSFVSWECRNGPMEWCQTGSNILWDRLELHETEFMHLPPNIAKSLGQGFNDADDDVKYVNNY